MAERKTGKGSRRSRQEWRSLLAKHEGSGLGVNRFADAKRSVRRWRL
jgi:hypothetical protein